MLEIIIFFILMLLHYKINHELKEVLEEIRSEFQ